MNTSIIKDVDKYLNTKSYIRKEDIKIMKKVKEDTESKSPKQKSLIEYFKNV